MKKQIPNDTQKGWKITSYLSCAVGIFSGTTVRKSEGKLDEALKANRETSNELQEALKNSKQAKQNLDVTLTSSEKCRQQTEVVLEDIKRANFKTN